MPIPIHMIYFPWGEDQKLRPDPHAFDHGPFENMKRYAPGFDVRLWIWPEAREWCRAAYPDLWALIEGLARPTMMVDLLRWLVVYHFGGIYWQYDMNPLVPMERMLPSSGCEAKVFTEFVNDEDFCRRMADEPIRKGEPEEPVRILNQCFSAAAPRNRFIRATLDLIVERARTLTPKRDYDILYICANAAVSTAYDRFGKDDPAVERVSREETRRLMRIEYKGSWRMDAERGEAPAPPAPPRAAAVVRGALKRVPGLARWYYRRRPHAHEALPGPGVLPAGWTPELSESLRAWAERESARSVLEFPCGEPAALPGLRCLAADFRRRPARRVRFLNPLLHRAPAADLLVCRDYLDFLPYREIRAAWPRLVRGAAWAAVTTYPLLNRNWDSALGDRRPLNYMRPPFGWPPPCAAWPDPDPRGRPDRALAVWRTADLPRIQAEAPA